MAGPAPESVILDGLNRLQARQLDARGVRKVDQQVEIRDVRVLSARRGAGDVDGGDAVFLEDGPHRFQPRLEAVLHGMFPLVWGRIAHLEPEWLACGSKDALQRGE